MNPRNLKHDPAPMARATIARQLRALSPSCSRRTTSPTIGPRSRALRRWSETHRTRRRVSGFDAPQPDSPLIRNSDSLEGVAGSPGKPIPERGRLPFQRAANPEVTKHQQPPEQVAGIALPPSDKDQADEDQPTESPSRRNVLIGSPFKRINEVTVDIRPKTEDKDGHPVLLPDDVDPLESRLDPAPAVPDQDDIAMPEPAAPVPGRQYRELTNYQWQPTRIGHNPLYFEEPNSERHGYTFGSWQPVTSAL